ncbi:MAG: hypothetical protein JO048_05495, partial [Methylobacteriaceae bacterium]|nr:hypothetical protein [Methylobacteriaceae bacterium]
LQRAQFASLKYTTLSTPAALQAAFRLFAEPALNMGGERAMARAFSELALHTRKSPLTVERSRGGGIRAGDRALDAAVVQDGEEGRLYEFIYRGGWTLLGFAGRGTRANLAAVVAACARAAEAGVASHLVTTSGENAGSLPALYDLDEEAHRVYGVDRPTVLLVRPDGHVAVRSAGDVAPVLDYARRWAVAHWPCFGQAGTREARLAESVAQG